MRSFVVAVVFFAGILAYSNAMPQWGLNEALIDLAKELAKEDRNSTIKFGNNTVIITGVASANANINRAPTQRPPHQPPSNQWPNQQSGWNNGNWNYYPGYGFWRTTPEQTEESIEHLVAVSEADMQEEEDDDREEALLDSESEEDDKQNPHLFQSDELSDEELSHEQENEEDQEDQEDMK